LEGVSDLKKSKSAMLQYLDAMLKLYKSMKNKVGVKFYKWLLKKGKLRNTKQFSKRELAELKHVLRQSAIQPAAKQCFYVSQMVLLTAPNKLKYIEGFANHIIPVEHAWLEYKGKVLDLVWGSLEHNQSPDGFSADPKCEYFGVEIPLEFITRNIEATHVAETLLQRFFMKESGIDAR